MTHTYNTALVSIVGAGHSGSTLLDMILGGHSSMLSLGEITRFDEYRVAELPCTCGHAVHSCTFWLAVMDKWEDLIMDTTVDTAMTDMRGYKMPGTANSVQNYLSIFANLILSTHKYPGLHRFACPELHRRRARICSLHSAIRQVSQKSLLIDSSKSVHRFRLLHSLKPNSSRAIFLTRDGRAIAASRLRKNVGTVPQITRKWWLTNQFTIIMMRTLPRSAYIHVRYEELCNEPEQTVQRICDYIGVPYEPEMLDFRSHERHILGGNRMRMDRKNEIQEDLKWTSTLNATALNEFERIAGRLNRKLLGKYFRASTV